MIKIFFVTLLVLATTCKKKSDCIGTPKRDCICTQEYNPVCECDNKTYGNACTASCAGVKTWKAWVCP